MSRRYTFLTVLIIALILLARAARAEDHGESLCEPLAAAIRSMELSERPPHFYDFGSLLQGNPTNNNHTISASHEQRFVETKNALDTMRAHGRVPHKLELQIQDFREQFGAGSYISTLTLGARDNVLGYYATGGTASCQRIEYWLRDKSGTWLLLPKLSDEEAGFCMQRRAGLVSINGVPAAIVGENKATQTTFSLTPLNIEATEFDSLWPACKVTVDFQAGFRAEVYENYESGSRYECKSDLCDFISQHGKAIAEAFQTGDKQEFTLSQVYIGKLLSDQPHLAKGQAVRILEHLYKDGDASIWSFQDLSPEFGAVVWRPQEEQVYIFPGETGANKDVMPSTHLLPSGRVPSTSYEFEGRPGDWKIEPFIYQDQVYFLRVGRGHFGWRVYPGYLLEVLALDGLEMKRVVSGALREQASSINNMSISSFH